MQDVRVPRGVCGQRSFPGSCDHPVRRARSVAEAHQASGSPTLDQAEPRLPGTSSGALHRSAHRKPQRHACVRGIPPSRSSSPASDRSARAPPAAEARHRSAQESCVSKNVAVFVDVANIFYAAKAAGVDIDYVTLLKASTAGRDLRPGVCLHRAGSREREPAPVPCLPWPQRLQGREQGHPQVR